jgi:hypothetical protein
VFNPTPPGGPTPTPTVTPTPIPPFVPPFIPQQVQNPFAMQALMGGISGARSTPVPSAPLVAPANRPSLGLDQAGRLPASPPTLRPPNTGDAGLAPGRRWSTAGWW